MDFNNPLPEPGSSIRIRKMELEDIPSVIAIDQVSFSLPWPPRSFKFELTQNPSSYSWVAEQVYPENPPVIIAFLVVWIILDEAHIATIAVLPAFRRRSVARHLLAEALIQAYEMGARSAYLEVRRGNDAARDMYQDFGFIEVGVRPRYYKDNFEDAVLMTLYVIEPEKLNYFRGNLG